MATGRAAHRGEATPLTASTPPPRGTGAHRGGTPAHRDGEPARHEPAHRGGAAAHRGGEPAHRGTPTAQHRSGGLHRSAAPAAGDRGWARARALLAAGVVVGVGGMSTLASWTDTEWVYAGSGLGGDPGVATSVFEVQQNVFDGAGGTANFTDRESAGSAGELDFTIASLSLTPGDTVYAPMQLRTVADSDGAELTLDGGTVGSGSTDLFDALTYAVRTDVPQGSCTSADFATTGSTLVASGTGLATGSGATTFALGAGGSGTPGAEVDLCFAITLPGGASSALQGQGVTPRWAFQAVSQ